MILRATRRIKNYKVKGIVVAGVFPFLFLCFSFLIPYFSFF
jgi:hypothetical protein